MTYIPKPGERCQGERYNSNEIVVGKFLRFTDFDGDASLETDDGDVKDCKPHSLRPVESIPPDVADALHGPSPNHCSLCGLSFADVKPKFVNCLTSDGIDGHSLCCPCSALHNGNAVDEIRRRKSLSDARKLAESSGGSDDCLCGMPSNHEGGQLCPEAKPADPYAEHRQTYGSDSPRLTDQRNSNDKFERIIAMSRGDELSQLASRRARHRAEVLAQIDSSSRATRAALGQAPCVLSRSVKRVKFVDDGKPTWEVEDLP